jgi:hypothetical protein
MNARSVSRRVTTAAAWLDERRAIGRRANERADWVPMAASSLRTTAGDLEKIMRHLAARPTRGLTIRRSGKTVP